MNIILTYDPRWEYTPEGHTPFWNFFWFFKQNIDGYGVLPGVIGKTVGNLSKFTVFLVK